MGNIKQQKNTPSCKKLVKKTLTATKPGGGPAGDVNRKKNRGGKGHGFSPRTTVAEKKKKNKKKKLKEKKKQKNGGIQVSTNRRGKTRLSPWEP